MITTQEQTFGEHDGPAERASRAGRKKHTTNRQTLAGQTDKLPLNSAVSLPGTRDIQLTLNYEHSMRCLIQWNQDAHWVQFRFKELNALLQMQGIEPASVYSNEGTRDDAFLLVDLPDITVAQTICKRAVLIKAIYECWCHGPTFHALITAAKNLPSDFIEPYLCSHMTWSVEVEAYCKSYSMQEKNELRNQFRFLDFKGKVQLGGEADVELWILIDHIALQRPSCSASAASYVPSSSSSSSSSSSAMVVDSSVDLSSSAMLISSANPINSTTTDTITSHSIPSGVSVGNETSQTSEGLFPAVPSYLCRLLSKGGMKEELKKYDLKKRLYLGPTSLDPLLAILMSNMAHVQRSQLVFDPFVGNHKDVIYIQLQ